jgi:hypothetical protein
MISLLAFDVFFLGHAFEIHAAHHFGHFWVGGHLFHHVHEVTGSSQLGHHLGVDHVLQLAHDLT